MTRTALAFRMARSWIVGNLVAGNWMASSSRSNPLRLNIWCQSLALGLLAGGLASVAIGQTYVAPAGGSRYAPQQPQAGAPVRPVAGPGQPQQSAYAPRPQGQPVQQAAGPIDPRMQADPRMQGPIRQVDNQQPIRQPQPGAGQPGVGQPIAGQPGIGPQNPALPAPPAAPRAPEWYPLDPAVQKWVDDVLGYWQQRSAKVETYRCVFQRWDYDPIFGPKDPSVPKTFAEGVIQYAQPDKGLFRLEKLSNYVAPAKAGDQPTYAPQTGTLGEHWICDGERIFEFDSRQKKVIERILPVEMQGKAIADGPLPFLFGADAAKISSRYWLRPLTPPEGVTEEYWLEAVPKTTTDASNFKMIHIIIDKKEFLPQGLQVFPPNYDPKTNPVRTAYTFKDREVNKVNLLNKLNPFLKDFFEPKTPSGWQRVVENLNVPPGPGAAGGPSQATRPVAPPTPGPASSIPR